MEEQRKCCDLAVGSLVFGLLSVPLGFLAGIPAIVCGLLARRRIVMSGGTLAGRGAAVAGLVLGVMMSVAGLLPWYQRSRTIQKWNAHQTQTDVLALEQAVDHFFSEFSKLPDPGADDFTTEDDAGRTLLVVLLGNEPAGPAMMNPRKIPFLNVRIGRHKKKSGLIYASESGREIEGFYDAWGNPFRMILDNDNDDVLRFSYGGKPLEVRGHGCLVASKGPDGVEGTKDDLKSWSDSR
jgi:hypothetical protein